MDGEGVLWRRERRDVGRYISTCRILLNFAHGLVCSFLHWALFAAAEMKFSSGTTLLATALAAPALAAEYAAEMYASGEIHSQIMETKHVRFLHSPFFLSRMSNGA